MPEPVKNPLSPVVVELLDSVAILAKRASELLIENQTLPEDQQDGPLAAVALTLVDLMALASEGRFHELFHKAQLELVLVPASVRPGNKKSGINPQHN